jgi:hypothetical protein
VGLSGKKSGAKPDFRNTLDAILHLIGALARAETAHGNNHWNTLVL